MRNYPELPVSEIIQFGKDAIDYLVLGFQNIGFRKSTKKRLDVLEDIVIKHEEEIKQLKLGINYED